MDTTIRNEAGGELSFGIISRSRHIWTEHTAQVVSVRATGLQIETAEPIEPGYVWLRQRIGGTRGGFLARSRRQGDHYRACIRLVPLTWNVEHCVRERVERREAIPLRDPADIIAGQVRRRPAAQDQ